MTSAHRGSCLCGEIRFEADRFETRCGHCHCSMCRKFHGAAYATYAEVKREHFRWTRGEKLLQAFVADNGTTRRFCSRCGSSLTFDVSDSDGSLVEVSLACFDDDTALRPDAHVFVANALDWARPQDELPKYQGDRDSPLVE